MARIARFPENGGVTPPYVKKRSYESPSDGGISGEGDPPGGGSPAAAAYCSP